MQKVLKTTFEKSIFAYYIILMIIMFLMLRSNYIGMAGRVTMFLLTILPGFVKPKMLPFSLVLFFCISVFSFSPVLPTEWYYYFIVFLVLTFACHKKPLQSVYLLFFLFFLLMDVFHLDVFGVNNHFFWIIIAIMISGFFITQEGLEYAVLTFIIVSLFLSVEYVVFRNNFLAQFGSHIYGMERGGWNNANMFGGMISLGAGLSVGVLTGMINTGGKKYKLLCVATIIIGVITLVMNASRGALLTFGSAVVLFIMFSSETKLYLKIIVLSLVTIGAIIILNSNIAELLMYRLTEEDVTGTGSGRTVIWATLINDFFAIGDIGELLFGVGYSKCCSMILGGQNSTHNDFVTALVAYGLIGFILFIFIIIGPFIIAKKKDKLNVLALTVPLFIECMVLEPIFRGYILYLTYYLFVLSFSIQNRSYEQH